MYVEAKDGSQFSFYISLVFGISFSYQNDRYVDVYESNHHHHDSSDVVLNFTIIIKRQAYVFSCRLLCNLPSSTVHIHHGDCCNVIQRQKRLKRRRDYHPEHQENVCFAIFVVVVDPSRSSSDPAESQLCCSEEEDYRERNSFHSFDQVFASLQWR